MATTAPTSALDHKLSRSPGKLGMLVFGAVLLVGVLYAGSSLLRDLSTFTANPSCPTFSSGSRCWSRSVSNSSTDSTTPPTPSPPSSTPTRSSPTSQ